MIENNPSNVSSAFEMLLEEVEAEIDFVNNVGSKAFEGLGKRICAASAITGLLRQRHLESASSQIRRATGNQGRGNGRRRTAGLP